MFKIPVVNIDKKTLALLGVIAILFGSTGFQTVQLGETEIELRHSEAQNDIFDKSVELLHTKISNLIEDVEEKEKEIERLKNIIG